MTDFHELTQYIAKYPLFSRHLGFAKDFTHYFRKIFYPLPIYIETNFIYYDALSGKVDK